MPLEHLGDIRLLDAETARRCRLSQFVLLNDSRDLAHELGLEGALIGAQMLIEIMQLNRPVARKYYRYILYGKKLRTEEQLPCRLLVYRLLSRFSLNGSIE
jgi:hypothetical protein